jgi:hypothetical protein
LRNAVSNGLENGIRPGKPTSGSLFQRISSRNGQDELAQLPQKTRWVNHTKAMIYRRNCWDAQ